MAKRMRRVAGLSTAIFLAAVTVTEARDLCINPDIRLSRFKQPARGQCLPVAGTYFESGGHYDRVSGTVCTRSDGTALILGLTVFTFPAPKSTLAFNSFFSIDIQLPGLTYLYSQELISGPGPGGSGGTGQAAYCSKVPIP